MPYAVDDPGEHVRAAIALGTSADSYNERQTIEAVMKEDKRALHRDHQRTHSFVANDALAQLGLLTTNLLTWFNQELLGDTPMQGIGISRFLHEALLLPARLVQREPDGVASHPASGTTAKTHFELRLLLPNLPAIRLICALADKCSGAIAPASPRYRELCAFG